MNRVRKAYGLYILIAIALCGVGSSLSAQTTLHKKVKPKSHHAATIKAPQPPKPVKVLKKIEIDKKIPIPVPVPLENKPIVQAQAEGQPIEIECSGMVEPTSIKKNTVQSVALWTSIPIIRDEASKKLFSLASQAVKIKGQLVPDKTSGKWILKVKQIEPDPSNNP